MYLRPYMFICTCVIHIYIYVAIMVPIGAVLSNRGTTNCSCTLGPEGGGIWLSLFLVMN